MPAGASEKPALLLTDLPVEILLHILQYLEVKLITDVLSRVCPLFRSLSVDDATWKIRVKRRWPGQYPALPPSPSFSWTSACIEREEESKQWRDGAASMVRCINSSAHYASVDAVHVMDSVVVSGSRDRSIHLWPVSPGPKLVPVARYPDVHKGWVWSFSSREDLLVSGAWDSLVKFWKITPSGMKEGRSEARLKTAVLTTDIHENRVVAGTFDNKVVQLDVRESSGPGKMTYYKSHKKPVLKVRISATRILSVSEDCTLVVHDRVAGKRLKRVQLPVNPPTLEQPNRSFPLSMDVLDNMIYIGDSTGNLHLIEATNDLYEIVHTYKTGHSGRVTSVVCGYGSYMTSSSDGTVRIYQPSRSMEPLSVMQVSECGQLTSLSYRNQVLAATGSSNSLCIWRRQ